MTHRLYIQIGRNETASVELILVMNNIADTIYRPHGFIVFVRVLCIWNDYDHFAVSAYLSNTQVLMEKFGYWIEKFYSDFSQATSALITSTKHGNTDYASFQSGYCNPNWGVLYTYVGNNHLFLAGSFMAHALGHMLDLKHDTPGCVCFRRSSCLMDEFPTLHDMMSNCSHSVIHNRIHGWDPCFSAQLSTYKNLNYAVPRCGNKVVEDREQCDCGSFKDCLSDMCCGTNCELIQGSACASGGCCEACKFAPTGTICRDKLGICDLPEYCTGISENCPGNFYIMDGTLCSPLAVCMSGNCSDRHLQCQALFGYQVKDASPACYRELNSRGDRFGNCGVKSKRGGSGPQPCQPEDVFCGLIHCDGVSRIPGGGEHTTFHHIRVPDVKEEQCFGYDAHHGTEIPEMGLVVDGANCAPGKYCKGQRCVSHNSLNFNCNISMCNFRGVCNNKGNCHCIRGWQPPHCIQRGTGGSVNSGPPPTTEKSLQAEFRVSVNRLIVILGIRMLLILASILFGAIVRAMFVPETKEETKHPTRNE